LVQIDLPLTGDGDAKIKSRLRELVAESAAVEPLLVLQFSSASDETGAATEFERALSLARFLTSDEVASAQLVAYVPRAVRGHAVLPVLACGQIVMADEAVLGSAGVGESTIDETMRAAYQTVAEHRLVALPPIALAMLDKQAELLKVDTADGIRYVDRAGVQRLQIDSVITEETTVVAVGELGEFTGRRLRTELGVVTHRAANLSELATALGLPAGALQATVLGEERTRAIRVEIHGVITSKRIRDAQHAMRRQLARGDVETVLVTIDSTGGSAVDSLTFASELAELQKIRTIAYIDSRALADSAAIAFACDELILRHDAELGGPGEEHLSEAARRDLEPPIRKIAAAKGRNWTIVLGAVDPQLRAHRYTRGDQERVFCEAEFSEKDADAWQREEEVNFERGFSAADVERFAGARVVDSYEDVERMFTLHEVERAEPGGVVLAIEQWAQEPWLARTLLIIAFFALMSEASAPGLGIPGFVSAVSFLLFFWVQFLSGSAGWLEALLFIGGVAAIVVELALIPGFGVFGIGGVVMVFGSLILASQTFVIPQNAYQMERFPLSIVSLAGSILGALILVSLIYRTLPKFPVFRQMMVLPPAAEQRAEISRRETLVYLDHLLGKRGVAATQLAPGGKARFGDETIDVITDGGLIRSGAAVVVREVLGNRVRVAPLEDVG
jgi:membrane-bound ClpP family serine protease